MRLANKANNQYLNPEIESCHCLPRVLAIWSRAPRLTCCNPTWEGLSPAVRRLF